ncbi:phosphotransferase [Streptomyces sp. IBSNAI002]|uniref:phosphotransferase n=1 Tax=Streptomyces sp. IBSNAI002 TaxID=3457500 RepID=UPI003FD1513C
MRTADRSGTPEPHDRPALPLRPPTGLAGILAAGGLGRLRPGAVCVSGGRNASWAVTQECGTPLFVKHVTGPAAGRRLANALAFERDAAHAAPVHHLSYPRILAQCEQRGVQVFEFIDGRPGPAVLDEHDLGAAAAHRLGRALGELHRRFRPAGDPRRSRVFPSEAALEALPESTFLDASHAELSVWRLLQNDPELCDAVRNATAAEQAAPLVAVHGDLRLAQVLWSGESVHVTDWEEYGSGDAAADVGTLVGDILWAAVLDMSRRARGNRTAASGCDVTDAGASALEHVKPVMAAAWRGYLEERPGADAGLARRTSAAAGGHLLNRVLAVARNEARLSATQRAAVGIGRALYRFPGDYAPALGLAP